MSACYKNDPVIKECGSIVGELFGRMDAMGNIRLRESVYFRPQFQVSDFSGSLKELFDPGG